MSSHRCSVTRVSWTSSVGFRKYAIYGNDLRRVVRQDDEAVAVRGSRAISATRCWMRSVSAWVETNSRLETVAAPFQLAPLQPLEFVAPGDVFPAGRGQPNDPTRPVTLLRTAWTKVREKAKVVGRWHDNRHTLVTELAESGAGDEVIMSIARHVSRAMLSRYSHVRMEAKRRALDEIAVRQRQADEARLRETQRQQ